jgi:putative tryptophan/tyrosine transport system substrate-binding protein
MNRREFIAGLGSAVAWPVVVRAQQSGIPAVGYIGSTDTETAQRALKEAFLNGLTEAGYFDGRNVAIEYRWVETHNERIPGFISDLVGRRVAVLAVVDSTAAVLAAKAATQSIPIVFRIGGDPVAAGIVPSLSRPGGNITGFTTLGVDLGAKRLQILREMLPADAAVALLSNPSNANAAREKAAIQEGAHLLGVRLLIFNATTLNEIEAAFAGFAAQNVRGLMTAAEPLFIQNRDRVVALADRYGIPAIYSSSSFFGTGGLMTYAVDARDGYRWAGIYTGRILSGEKPADLPVQQSTKVLLHVNLKTAKALGLTIPETLLATADDVIQ